jgi:hypothetical protein
MNYILSLQVASGGYHRLARFQPSYLCYNPLTFFQNFRSSSPVDSAIDTSPAHQSGVSSVDNSIGRLSGNITLKQSKLGFAYNFFVNFIHIKPPLITL